MLWYSLLLPHSWYKLCSYWITFDCDDVGIFCCDEFTGWIIEELWCNSEQTFLSLKCLDWFFDSPSCILIGPGGLSPGLEMPGPKANHPSISDNEVLNEWSYTSSSLNAFMTCTETPLPLRVGSMLTDTSVTFYQSARCNIPEGLNFHQHYCQNHRLCKKELYCIQMAVLAR